MTDQPTVADPQPGDLCRVCRGKFEDHKDTIHAFTPLDGDLITKQEAVQRIRKQKGPQAQPQGMSPEFKRLMAMLKEKGVIDDAEAMYVMLGDMNFAQVGSLIKSNPGDQLQ